MTLYINELYFLKKIISQASPPSHMTLLVIVCVCLLAQCSSHVTLLVGGNWDCCIHNKKNDKSQ